ncbi:Homeodomain-like protein [Aspergillus avenaceus]|uniref:Homeodomain-like protein n=1 Tax=Aspergillus avenaceus TaxID=36643 RepID=A0A5N6U8Z4_ASPAV|nr:Homeodomain-like protein [Aspergillus avenaceus]
MSSRRTWTGAEDERLVELIRRFGDRRGREGKWHEISKHLPGRTNKDCRKRWFHSLDPSLRKGRWTNDEDKLLRDAYERLGPSWKEIALLIPGRKDDQCAKRYNDILKPSCEHRLRGWDPEEDDYLRAKVTELGHKWAVIAAGLPGRPPLTCRNRWRKLSRGRDKSADWSSTDSPCPLNTRIGSPSPSAQPPKASSTSSPDNHVAQEFLVMPVPLSALAYVQKERMRVALRSLRQWVVEYIEKELTGPPGKAHTGL